MMAGSARFTPGGRMARNYEQVNAVASGDDKRQVGGALHFLLF